eukprot:353104-Chlamydomonas_euryale.AAC.6
MGIRCADVQSVPAAHGGSLFLCGRPERACSARRVAALVRLIAGCCVQRLGLPEAGSACQLACCVAQHVARWPAAPRRARACVPWLPIPLAGAGSGLDAAPHAAVPQLCPAPPHAHAHARAHSIDFPNIAITVCTHTIPPYPKRAQPRLPQHRHHWLRASAAVPVGHQAREVRRPHRKGALQLRGSCRPACGAALEKARAT